MWLVNWLLSSTTKTISEICQIIQSIVTTIGIIIGGIWVLHNYQLQRQGYASINLKHKVSHIELSNEINLLRVVVVMHNVGKSRVLFANSQVRIQQIKPLQPCNSSSSSCPIDQINELLLSGSAKSERFLWPLLAGLSQPFLVELEPNEKREIDFEFPVPAKVTNIRIYTFFDKESDWLQPLDAVNTWDLSSYYKFKGNNKKGNNKTVSNLSPVYFRLGDSRVLSQELTKVRKLAGFLLKNPDFRVLLIGHTDRNYGIGKMSHSSLSRMRAEAVKDKLRLFGILDSYIKNYVETIGAGHTSPVFNKNGRENEALSRRVEVIIVR